MSVTFVTLECVRARVWLLPSFRSECMSVCVALVAGAGRRCKYPCVLKINNENQQSWSLSK